MTGPAAVSGSTPRERREALKQELRAYRIESINGLDEYTDGGLADRALNLVESWLAKRDVEIEQYKALADVNDLNAWTDHVRKRVAIERADERRRTAEKIKRQVDRVTHGKSDDDASTYGAYGHNWIGVPWLARICDEVGGSE